eukprot:TRINITY_DN12635_c0_g1_i2.p1 TRINITY_DN12635_c0_g1~~TRINITY_DN12635_c0_g1_i2.p1  ORF type:complete len:116 (-),score=2.67 TRINITY_DN12635_c0_g1_i2:87-434(-)
MMFDSDRQLELANVAFYMKSSNRLCCISLPNSRLNTLDHFRGELSHCETEVGNIDMPTRSYDVIRRYKQRLGVLICRKANPKPHYGRCFRDLLFGLFARLRFGCSQRSRHFRTNT